MDLLQYKCPCCGSSLHFGTDSQKMKCDSCGNEYDIETLKELNQAVAQGDSQDIKWQNTKFTETAKKQEDGTYLCPSCGASVEADEKTISTICPFCSNVVVIRAAVAGETEPDAIIPFKVDGKKAQKMFEDYCKDKKLLPKGFKNGTYLKNLKGYYVPYWLFDCDVAADMTFNTTKKRVWSDANYNYEEISYYLVHRNGKMQFFHLPVDGSTKAEDETTESVEPFDYKDLTEFQPAYLAGYETEKYDVESKDAEKRANERLVNSAEYALRNTVVGYDSVSTKNKAVQSQNGKVSYALLPIWMFDMMYNGNRYQFAINGQTGKMVGELPVDKGAYWKYVIEFTAIGTIIFSILGIIFFGGIF